MSTNPDGNAQHVAAATTTTTAKTTGSPVIRLPSNPKTHYANDNQEEGVVAAVESFMNYCAPHATQMQTRRDLGGSDAEWEGAAWVYAPVMLHSARLAAAEKTLDRNGFQLVHHPIPNTHEIDFMSSDSVIDHYYPLCQQLVKESTGAPMVYAFDHNVRVSGNPPSTKKQQEGGNNNNGIVPQQPVGVVHNDYTHVSAPRRLEQLGQAPKANDSLKSRLGGSSGEESSSSTSTTPASLLDPQIVQEVLAGERRFAFVNVWRNIDRESPVLQFPLACVDATTQSLEELLTFQIIYADRIGENYFSRQRQAANQQEQHEWNYFPQMTHDEVILLKQWDSEGTLAQQGKDASNGNGNDDDAEEEHFQSTFSLHSAFQDPTSPEDAPPRQSIEVRCVLIWDKK